MSQARSIVSSADLVIIPGRKADLTIPLSGGNSLHYQVGTFAEKMRAGRGFIAIAIVVLGRWHPLGAAMAALLFGAVWLALNRREVAALWATVRGSGGTPTA